MIIEEDTNLLNPISDFTLYVEFQNSWYVLTSKLTNTLLTFIQPKHLGVQPLPDHEHDPYVYITKMHDLLLAHALSTGVEMRTGLNVIAYRQNEIVRKAGIILDNGERVEGDVVVCVGVENFGREDIPVRILTYKLSLLFKHFRIRERQTRWKRRFSPRTITPVSIPGTMGTIFPGVVSSITLIMRTSLIHVQVCVCGAPSPLSSLLLPSSNFLPLQVKILIIGLLTPSRYGLGSDVHFDTSGQTGKVFTHGLVNHS